jgi:hypothetical protein
VALLRQQVFDGGPLPPTRRVIEDVDVSTLDAGHVRPNMGVPVWRGVWWPRRVCIEEGAWVSVDAGDAHAGAGTPEDALVVQENARPELRPGC